MKVIHHSNLHTLIFLLTAEIILYFLHWHWTEIDLHIQRKCSDLILPVMLTLRTLRSCCLYFFYQELWEPEGVFILHILLLDTQAK